MLDPVRHAVIIGVDGCRSDAVVPENCPVLCGMRPPGTDVWSKTSRITLSAPAWTSALTGYWPKRHGVLNNQQWENYKASVTPSVFDRLARLSEPIHGGAIVSWGALTTPLLAGCHTVKAFDGKDEAVADEFVRRMQSPLHNKGSLWYLHLGAVDMAGHAHGFVPEAPEYIDAIRRTDDLLRTVRSSITKRVRLRPEEQWLVVVATDHGGNGKHHRGHGDDTPIVRRNFVWANYLDSAGDAGRKIPGRQMVDVAHFVYQWFGVDSVRLLIDRDEDPNEQIYRETYAAYAAQEHGPGQ